MKDERDMLPGDLIVPSGLRRSNEHFAYDTRDWCISRDGQGEFTDSDYPMIDIEFTMLCMVLGSFTSHNIKYIVVLLTDGHVVVDRSQLWAKT